MFVKILKFSFVFLWISAIMSRVLQFSINCPDWDNLSIFFSCNNTHTWFQDVLDVNTLEPFWFFPCNLFNQKIKDGLEFSSCGRSNSLQYQNLPLQMNPKFGLASFSVLSCCYINKHLLFEQINISLWQICFHQLFVLFCHWNIFDFKWVEDFHIFFNDLVHSRSLWFIVFITPLIRTIIGLQSGIIRLTKVVIFLLIISIVEFIFTFSRNFLLFESCQSIKIFVDQIVIVLQNVIIVLFHSPLFFVLFVFFVFFLVFLLILLAFSFRGVFIWKIASEGIIVPFIVIRCYETTLISLACVAVLGFRFWVFSLFDWILFFFP